MGEDRTKIITFGAAQVYIDSADLGHTDERGVVCKVATEMVHAYVARWGKKLPAKSFIASQGAEVEFHLSQTVMADLVKALPGATLVTGAGKSKLTFGHIAGTAVTPVAITFTPLISSLATAWPLTIAAALPVGDFELDYHGTKEQTWACKFIVVANESSGADGSYAFVFGDTTASADLVAPTATVVPADDATGVSRSTAVTYTVSKNLNGATVHKGSVLLFSEVANELVQIDCGDPVLTNAGASTTIELTPLSTLGGTTMHQAILLATVKDTNGNAFAAPVIAEFTTAA